MKYVLLIHHGNNADANAPQCYVYTCIASPVSLNFGSPRNKIKICAKYRQVYVKTEIRGYEGGKKKIACLGW